MFPASARGLQPPKEDWEPPPPPPLPPRDVVFRTPQEWEEFVPDTKTGTKKLGQNALGIYAHPPPVDSGGDVVLPRATTDEPPAPYIRKVDKNADIRRRTSILDDPEISQDEAAGASYWDAIRRSDNPKTAYSPSPKLMGKRK
jgi:hypothetical protein